ncbi:cyclic pyranopterin monophosphate synthase MoaC [Allopusillimonas ginsengisoli]|uniref:cyclic pyranopterin monophosphate synthase MoaC n=1 Tax=Allopusillimonas ginsengisoli TaxID=453575 RepID=UPI00101F9F38|nr:cyclic pyranopterin monophosphate synthase MoaC [Allopusillimonas ginsengisoli]TEA80184.1 cyclic pyranopterin monophosphate synthase MoaC [Allopusillimonas ginsengisoli]
MTTVSSSPASPINTASDAPRLTHLDDAGKASMVDVGDKPSTQRTAIAQGRVRMGAAAFELLSASKNAKGEVLNTARIAGILAAKRCADLIPMCHSLPLSYVGIDFETDPQSHSITVLATCRSDYKTGVEMEAMTACSIAALTIYDMCKAADKGIVIDQIRLRSKTGGKSGDWQAADF